MRLRGKHVLIIASAGVIVVLAWFFLIPKYVDYQGREFRVTRSLLYPGHVVASEAGQVEKLILDAQVAPVFKTRGEIDSAIAKISFPGSEFTLYGEQIQKDGSKIAMWSVEVPRQDEDRYFVFHEDKSGYTLVDTFVLKREKGSEDVSEIHVRLENGHIDYTRDGTLVREKQL